MQVWSKAPVSNKQSHVWSAVNEQEGDPEAKKAWTHMELCAATDQEDCLSFIIFIAQSSFLNYSVHSLLATAAHGEWTGRPHARPDGLHLSLTLSLGEVKPAKLADSCDIEKKESTTETGVNEYKESL